MKPITFEQSNGQLVAPGCNDLPVVFLGNGISSCWKLTEFERSIVARDGVIWLTVIGEGHPPVILSTKAPFEEEEEEEVKRGRLPGVSPEESAALSALEDKFDDLLFEESGDMEAVVKAYMDWKNASLAASMQRLDDWLREEVGDG